MIALVRYELDDSLRSLRWAAPLLVFLMSQGLLDLDTQSVLPTYAGSAAVLFFVSTWLAVVVCNAEDPIQELITIAASGGAVRVRIAKLVSAYVSCLPLIVLALAIPPLVSSSHTTLADISTGAASLVLTVALGVALGALCSRPIIKKTAYAVLFGVALDLADAVTPGAPPVRPLVDRLGETQPHSLGALMLVIAVETIALAIVVVAASLRLARHSS